MIYYIVCKSRQCFPKLVKPTLVVPFPFAPNLVVQGLVEPTLEAMALMLHHRARQEHPKQCSSEYRHPHLLRVWLSQYHFSYAKGAHGGSVRRLVHTELTQLPTL